MADRITQLAGAGPALGGGDAGVAQPHQRVTLPLPVHVTRTAGAGARPGQWVEIRRVVNQIRIYKKKNTTLKKSILVVRGMVQIFDS